MFFFQTEEEILSNENDIDRLEKAIRGEKKTEKSETRTILESL